jgi:hypothetical protein
MGHNHSPEGPKKANGPKERQPKRQNQQQEQQGEQRRKSLLNRPRPKSVAVKLQPAMALTSLEVSSRDRVEELIQQTEFKKERQRQLEEQWRQDMQRSPESMTQASDTERE